MFVVMTSSLKLVWISLSSFVTSDVIPVSLTMSPCRNPPSSDNRCDYFLGNRLPRKLTLNCMFLATFEIRIEWHYLMRVKKASLIYVERNAGDNIVTDLVLPHENNTNKFYHNSILVIMDHELEELELVKNSSVTCMAYRDDDKLSEMSVRVGTKENIRWYNENEVMESEDIYFYCNPGNIIASNTIFREIQLLKLNEESGDYELLASADVETLTCQRNLKGVHEEDRDRYHCASLKDLHDVLNFIVILAKSVDTGQYVCAGQSTETTLKSLPFNISVIIRAKIVAFKVSPCEDETSECFLLTCIVHGPKNAKIEWTFSSTSRESDKKRALRELFVEDTQVENINGELFRYSQVARVRKDHQIFEPTCVTAKYRLSAPLEEINIITVAMENRSFSVTCSNELFNIPISDLKYLQIAMLSPVRRVLLTYTKEYDLICKMASDTIPGNCSVHSDNDLVILTAIVPNFQCKYTGWYQCSTKCKRSQQCQSLDITSKVIIQEYNRALHSSNIYVMDCPDNTSHACHVRSGETFHINCSTLGPYEVWLEWNYTIRDYPYMIREYRNSIQLGRGSKYCTLYYHESILTVYMASTPSESVKYSCRIFTNNILETTLSVNVEVKARREALTSKTIVQETESVDIRCTLDMFFDFAKQRVEYIMIAKSTTPTFPIVIYKFGGSPPWDNDTTKDGWDLKYSDEKSVSMRKNNIQCSDSGWYRCVSQRIDSSGDRYLSVLKNEIIVTGYYDKIKKHELYIPRCEGLKHCFLQEIPSHKVYLGCNAVGPWNLQMSLESEGAILNLKSRRKPVSQNRFCSLYYHQIEGQINVTGLTGYRCEFQLGDTLLQEHINVEYDDTPVNVHNNVRVHVNEIFSVVCSGKEVMVKRGVLKYLEVYKASTVRMVQTEDMLVSYIYGQDVPDFVKNVNNRQLQVALSKQSNSSINVTVMDARCSDSGYYFCIARATDAAERTFKVITDMTYVQVLEINRPQLSVPECKPGNCEVGEGVQLQMNCSFTFSNVYEDAVSVQWFHSVSKKKVELSLSSAYQIQTHTELLLVRNETLDCPGNELMQLTSILTISSVSANDPFWYHCESYLHSNFVRRESMIVFVRKSTMALTTIIFASMSMVLLLFIAASAFTFLKTLETKPKQDHSHSHHKKERSLTSTATVSATSSTESVASTSTVSSTKSQKRKSVSHDNLSNNTLVFESPSNLKWRSINSNVYSTNQ